MEQPVITGVGSVDGIAPENVTVKIFHDPDDEGLVYDTTVFAIEIKSRGTGLCGCEEDGVDEIIFMKGGKYNERKN